MSETNDLYDSGIGQDGGSHLSLSARRSRHGRAGSDSGSSTGNHARMNGGEQHVGDRRSNVVPSDMDPLEYEFLQQQANSDVDSDDRLQGSNLMDSLAINGNSLNGSRSSLVSDNFHSPCAKHPRGSTVEENNGGVPAIRNILDPFLKTIYWQTQYVSWGHIQQNF